MRQVAAAVTAHPLSMDWVITGSCCWMALTRWAESLVERKSVPMLEQPAYAGFVLKKLISFARAVW